MKRAALGRPDLRVWIAGGAVALALHASFALELVRWHDRVPGDDGNAAVLVDLAPLMEEPQAPAQQDLAPGPPQEQAPVAPEPPKQELQQQTEETVQPKEEPQRQTIEEKIEPLPTVPNAEAVLPKPKEKPVAKPKAKPVRPPAPATTAPPRPHPSAAQASTWHRQIAIALQRHKGYPAAAQAQRETGTATVSFTIDRAGRVISAHIARSSQHAALDAETLATVHRAAPFPPPPANLPGQRFDFTVPIQFNIR